MKPVIREVTKLTLRGSNLMALAAFLHEERGKSFPPLEMKWQNCIQQPVLEERGIHIFKLTRKIHPEGPSVKANSTATHSS